MEHTYHNIRVRALAGTVVIDGPPDVVWRIEPADARYLARALTLHAEQAEIMELRGPDAAVGRTVTVGTTVVAEPRDA